MKSKKRIISFILGLSILAGSIPLISGNSFKAAEKEWNFSYTGAIQEWSAPKKGKYFIEITGGRGGGFNAPGGAAISGFVNLEKDETLYLAIGGDGTMSFNGAQGGWNGGGNSYTYAGSGGGASHIATKLIGDGQLKNYEENIDDLLVVCGGGGGSYWDDTDISFKESVPYVKGEWYDLEQLGGYSDIYYTLPTGVPAIKTAYHSTRGTNGYLVGYGGIEKGTDSYLDNNGNTISGYETGATQASGYMFGQGQDGNTKLNGGHTGAAGGGLYGGFSVDTNTYLACPGGGGSGYLSDDLKDVSRLNTLTGNVRLRITYVPQETILTLKTNGHGSYHGQTGVVEIKGDIGDVVDLSEIEPDEDYTITKITLEYGDGELKDNKYTFGIENSCINVSYRANIDVQYKIYNDEVMFFEANVGDNTDKTFELYKSIDNEDYRLMDESEYNYLGGTSKQWQFTGSVQEFDTTYPGIYRLLCAGGGGYGTVGYPSKGSIASGEVWLDEGQKLYVYVGGTSNTFNGGGSGGSSLKSVVKSTNGSGATDFRLIPSSASDGWSGEESLLSRIVTAGGGAGTVVTAGRDFNGPELLSSYSNTTSKTGVSNHYGESSNGVLGKGSSEVSASVRVQQQNGYNGTKPCIIYGDEGYGLSGGGGGGWYGGATRSGVSGSTYRTYDDARNNCYGKYGWLWKDGIHVAGAQTYAYSGTSNIQNGYSYEDKTFNFKNSTIQQMQNSTNGYASATYVSFDSDADFSANLDVRDKAAPDVPETTVEYHYENGVTFHISEAVKDHGTNYQFKFVATDDTTNEIYQQYETEEYLNLSGLKGFHYYIDTSATGTVTKSNTFTDDFDIFYAYDYSKTMYLHVAAVDYAGNLSDTFTIDIQPLADYTVIYYIENEDGSYTKQEIVLTDIIGKTVTPDLPTFTGRDTPEKQSAVIKADGSTVLEFYYDITRFDINGTVQWNDHNNIYGTRPEDIKVTIYRDGEYFDEVIVSASNNSNSYTIPGVQKYDLETGREFVYTAEQETAYSQAALATSEDKYLTKQSGYNFLNTINNTNADKPEKPDPDNPDDKGFFVEGDIYWNDNNDSLGFRPSEVTITLYQKGEDGEFVEYDSVVVDANTENYYLFDWLPKYWYDEDGVPTKYEYKVEETFTAWYVEDGVIKDAYEVHPDTPKDCDFTNDFVFPTGPIIPVNEYTNTLTVVTNTDEEVRIILKPEELIVNPDYSVSYGDQTGDDIPAFVDKTGTVLTDLPSTRYEVVVDSPEYVIDDMTLTLPENMRLEHVGDKWYLVIENQPGDAIGTLEVELTKKEVYYQDRSRINNYFACLNKDASEVIVTKVMSLFGILTDEEPVVETTDENTGFDADSEITDMDSEIENKDVSEDGSKEDLSDDLESSEDIKDMTEEKSDTENIIEDVEDSFITSAEDAE